MFDIGMTELLVIGVVALIVVGPKDLPGMFRTLGRFTAKARSLGREFTRAMNDAADQSGVGDAVDTLKGAANPKKMGLDAIKDAATKFENWDPSAAVTKPDVKPAAERGGETAKLAKERAEAAATIRDATARKAEARIAREKAEEAAKLAEEAAKAAEMAEEAAQSVGKGAGDKS